jgi:hypothetical protein
VATKPEENPYCFVEESWRGNDNLSILLHTHFKSIGKFKLPNHGYAYADLLHEIVRRKRDIVLDMYERKALLQNPAQNPYWFLKDVFKNCDHKSITLHVLFKRYIQYTLPVLEDEDASALMADIFKRKDSQLQNHAPAHREPHVPQFSQQYVTTPPRPQQYVTTHMPQFSQQSMTTHMPQFSQQSMTTHMPHFTQKPPSAAQRYEEIEEAPEGYTDDWIKDGRVYSEAQKYEYSQYYYRKRAWRYAKEQPIFPESAPSHNPFQGVTSSQADDYAYEQRRSAFWSAYRVEKEDFLQHPGVRAAIQKASYALQDFIYGQQYRRI